MKQHTLPSHITTDTKDAIEADLAERIRNGGWLQGTCLSLDHFPEIVQKAGVELNLAVSSEHGWFAVLVANDCAVVCPSLEKEPVTEILLVRVIEDWSAAYRHCRNPRLLHFSFMDGSEIVKAEARIHHRLQIDRTLLPSRQPMERQINPKGLSDLRRWLAMRYQVDTFPDAFNERLEGVEKAIKELLEGPECENIGALYVEVEPRDSELDNMTPYHIRLLLPLLPGKSPDDATQELLDELCEKLGAVLSNVPGIKLKSQPDWLPAGQVNLEMIARMRRLTLEYLSVKKNNPLYTE